ILRTLITLLLLATANCSPAYSSDQLLLWLQRSNFGYQVLQQALNSSVESACTAQVRLLLQNADAQSLPALRVLDAWGKFPHGLLYGHFSDMGNYDSCLQMPLNIENKYCLAHIQFESLVPQPPMNTLSIQIGACLPASCAAAHLNDWMQAYLAELFGEQSPGQATQLLVQEESCALRQQNGEFSVLDWCAIVLFSVLALLVLLSTIIDYCAAHQLLLCFSLRRNLPPLFATANSPHLIPCLHGIRCLTIIWIIYGHDYMFLLLSPLINALAVKDWAQTPYSMLLQSGSISVDTFFMLSGMLLVLSTLRQLERSSGRLNVPLMYLHRLVRLTPVLAVAVLLFMTLFWRLDSGPLWQQFTSAHKLCNDTWWATLLYVQNYAAAGRMCLGHSWYLAVDMQLFLLSPLLLLPLWRWRRRAVAGIVVLMLLLLGCLCSIIVLNQLTVFQRDGNLGADTQEMRLIYYTTHARAVPWLVGLLFGYFLHCERGRQRHLSVWMQLLCWLLALGAICAVIWSLYPYTQPEAAEITITPWLGACYMCCSRVCWPLAICWLIWACQQGKAGAINQLLSWSFWQPISKLSYCMYIFHLLVEMINTGRIKSSLHFSNYDAILRCWSDFGITMLVSLAMYLCVETPMVRLELQLLGLRRKVTKPSTSPPPPIDSQLATPRTTPANLSQQNLVEA
ncbi:CG42329, partial [Drosophila busckii]